MKFEVRFQYDPDDADGYDLLESFHSAGEARQFRTEQLALECWEDEDGSESDQYVIAIVE